MSSKYFSFGEVVGVGAVLHVVLKETQRLESTIGKLRYELACTKNEQERQSLIYRIRSAQTMQARWEWVAAERFGREMDVMTFNDLVWLY